MMRKTYQHSIPTSRLGTSHNSLASFINAVTVDSQQKSQQAPPTEFSLLVILSRNAHGGINCATNYSNISILLGKKLRGFGKGFYNCFGGKLEKSRGEHNHPAEGAVREIHEETGIDVPISVMEDGYVGTINFTFEDSDVYRAMRVQLYCIFVELSHDAKIEISPQISNPDASKEQNNGNGKKKNHSDAHSPVTIHPN